MRAKISSVLRWPVFLVANIAILLLVGVSAVRESYRGWTVDREIHALEAQAEDLEGRKMKLIQLADSLVQPERVDLDARRQLGWKKPGERVVVLSGMQTTTTASTDQASTLSLPTEPPLPSNPVRWWRYFFHP